MAKDIVYIDVDDEITTVINKVEASHDKVVALVLPKRATVFQSTVNMKLLKKAASAAKKSLVLITSDTSILPLAGVAGLHVAKSLQSKPSLPAAPSMASETTVVSSDELEAASVAPAAAEAAMAANLDAGADEVIELDNTDKTTKKAVSSELGAQIQPKKNRKLIVPNFNRFRVKVFLAVFALILVIVGWVFGFIILPKAKITIKTDASSVNTSLQFTASVSAKTLDKDKLILPAHNATNKKTDSAKVSSTGKKDIGTKATGTISIYNCTDNDVVLPAGTTFSNNGYSFGTDADATIPNSDFFSAGSGGACKKNRNKSVAVTAIQAGGSSNLSAGREYTSSFASTVTGTGSAMGGGTSNVVTVVSPEDITSAQSQLTDKSKNAALEDVKQQLVVANLVPLTDTLTQTAPTYTYSAAAGDQVADVTVTSVVSYNMLGVAQDDLKAIIEASLTKQITSSQQKILDNGLGSKTLSLIDKKSPSEQRLSITTNATIGPDINSAAIAKEFAGKKRGDILQSLSVRAGVKDVTVTYSPFWVFQTPTKASKITVDVEANAK